VRAEFRKVSVGPLSDSCVAANTAHYSITSLEQRRNGKAKRLRGFDIDHQLKSGWLFDREGLLDVRRL
jgi:hypothetical protein